MPHGHDSLVRRHVFKGFSAYFFNAKYLTFEMGEDQLIWMKQSITREETHLTLPGQEQPPRWVWSSAFSQACTAQGLPSLPHTLWLRNGPRQRVSGVLQRSKLWRGKFNFPDGSSGYKRCQYSSRWLINAKVAKVYLAKVEISNAYSSLTEWQWILKLHVFHITLSANNWL